MKKIGVGIFAFIIVLALGLTYTALQSIESPVNSSNDYQKVSVETAITKHGKLGITVSKPENKFVKITIYDTKKTKVKVPIVELEDGSWAVAALEYDGKKYQNVLIEPEITPEGAWSLPMNENTIIQLHNGKYLAVPEQSPDQLLPDEPIEGYVTMSIEQGIILIGQQNIIL